MAILVCVHGNNLQQEFEIKEGTNRIGRAPSSDIVIFDKRCSRNHCEIYRRGKYYSIEDLGSRHGTYVNGKNLSKRHELRMGDRIQLGNSVLLFTEEGKGSELDRLTSELTHDLHEQEKGDFLLDVDSAPFGKSSHSGGRSRKKKGGLFGGLFGKK